MSQPSDVLEKTTLNFEDIPTQGLNGFSIRRARIPGGWLVTSLIDHSGTLCFIPDRFHLWDGGNEDSYEFK